MSNNSSCIESILDMENSELAERMRKRLPKQARLYDKKKGLSTGAETPTYTVTGEQSQNQEERQLRVGVYDKDSASGDWMQRQDNKRALRRNKYGDIVYDDDVK